MNLKTKFKQLNEIDSLYLQLENLQKQNHELKMELTEVKDELEEFKSNYGQFEALFFEATQTLKNDIHKLKRDVGEVPVVAIGESEFGENILKYNLRTSPQTQSKNYRYFYKSNYLFTAPLKLKNLLNVEFNNLMNSNLSFENVVKELKIYKESLENELISNSVQTELGVV